MKIKIIYETETGTTQYVAEVLQKKLNELGHQTDIHSIHFQGMDPKISEYEVLLFGSPTYEEGSLESSMKEFIDQFNQDLSHHKIAVFGLGSRSYGFFCNSATILEDWVKKNGGTPLLPALRIDGFPEDLAPIDAWAVELNGLL